MKNYQTEISINAPAEKVWETLMDHKNYGDWNPFITSIEGNAKVNEVLKVNLQMEGSKGMSIAPKVLQNDGKSEFRWLGHMGFKGLFDGEHYFKVEAISPTESRFIHGENFSGILRSLILAMVGKKTLQGFKAMNLALKNRVEANL